MHVRPVQSLTIYALPTEEELPAERLPPGYLSRTLSFPPFPLLDSALILAFNSLIPLVKLVKSSSRSYSLSYLSSGEVDRLCMSSTSPPLIRSDPRLLHRYLSSSPHSHAIVEEEESSTCYSVYGPDQSAD